MFTDGLLEQAQSASTSASSSQRSPLARRPDPAQPSAVSIPPGRGALSGFRVSELGTLIAGPFCGRLLADHGADVIEGEAPDRPDPLRDWGQAEEHLASESVLEG